MGPARPTTAGHRGRRTSGARCAGGRAPSDTVDPDHPGGHVAQAEAHPGRPASAPQPGQVVLGGRQHLGRVGDGCGRGARSRWPARRADGVVTARPPLRARRVSARWARPAPQRSPSGTGQQGQRPQEREHAAGVDRGGQRERRWRREPAPAQPATGPGRCRRWCRRSCGRDLDVVRGRRRTRDGGDAHRAVAGEVAGGPGPPGPPHPERGRPGHDRRPGVDGGHAVDPDAVDEHPVGGPAVLDRHAVRADADEEVACGSGTRRPRRARRRAPDPRCRPGGASGWRRPASGPPTTTRSRSRAGCRGRGRRARPTHCPGWRSTATRRRRAAAAASRRGSRRPPRGPREVRPGTGSPRWSPSAAQQVGDGRPAGPLDHDLDGVRPSPWKWIVRVISMSATVGSRPTTGPSCPQARPALARWTARSPGRRRGALRWRVDGRRRGDDNAPPPARARAGAGKALVGRPRGRPPRRAGLVVARGAGPGRRPAVHQAAHRVPAAAVGGQAHRGRPTRPRHRPRLTGTDRGAQPGERRPLRRDRRSGGAVGDLAVRPGGVRGRRRRRRRRAGDPASSGIDLEIVEPRSDGFVTDFLTRGRAGLGRGTGRRGRRLGRDAAANLVWSAKEAALKVLRLGLRADTRWVEIAVATDPDADGWARFDRHLARRPVSCRAGGAATGCYLLTVAAGTTSTPRGCSRAPRTWRSRRPCTAGSAGRSSSPPE